MKKINFFIFSLLLTTTLFSCISVQTASDYDETIDFNHFKTYAFYKPDIDRVLIEDGMKRDVLRLIESEFDKKGYTKSLTPDLLLSFALNVEDVYDDNYYVNTLNDIYASNYKTTEGVLYIGLIDAKSYTLIWEGVGAMRINEYMTASEIDSFFKKTVKGIMKEYPPN